MERKNAIKFLQGWGIVTVALVLAFPLILTPLVNAVDIPVAIFDAAMIGGFVGWSIYTVVAIKAIYTVLKTNKSPTKTIKPKSTKTSKEDNSNSEYIKIDKKLFNTILVIMGVIAVFYIGYNIGGNSNTAEESNNSTAEESNNSTVEESNNSTVEESNNSTELTNPNFAAELRNNELERLDNLKIYHINELIEREEILNKRTRYKVIRFYLKSSGKQIKEGAVYNDFGLVARFESYSSFWYNIYDSFGNVIEARLYMPWINRIVYYDTNKKLLSHEKYDMFTPGVLKEKTVCSSEGDTKYNGIDHRAYCEDIQLIEYYDEIGWNDQKGEYDVKLKYTCYPGSPTECYYPDGSKTD